MLGRDRSSLKKVMTELNFQGGAHHMDHMGARAYGGGHSTIRSMEVWKRRWGTMGVYEMTSPCRGGIVKEACTWKV